MAVRANELRVGNWVSYDGFTLAEPVHKMIEVQVKSITGAEELDGINWEWDHDNGGYCLTGFQQLEGIPLSEDWLLRFGFEHYELKTWTDPEMVFGRREMRLDISMEHTISWDATLGISLNKERMDHIQYVHQLQNLIFSLTSSELTTKQ